MYIVKKPLTIGSERRPVGSVVTAEEAPNAALLERTGYLVKAQEPFTAALESTGFIIPLMDKNGIEEVSIAEDEALTIFSLLQMGVDDAVSALEEEKSEAVLKLICNCDHRKTVISAAKARMKVVVEE